MRSPASPRIALLGLALLPGLAACTPQPQPTSGTPDAAVAEGTPLPTAAAAASATAALTSRLPGGWESFGEAGTDPGQMILPFDISADGQGGLYVCDSTGLSRYGRDGSFQARIGEGQIKRAEAVAVGPDGDVYVAGNGSQVEVYGADGGLKRKIGTVGSDRGQLVRPVDLAFDDAGMLYVVDTGNRRVEVFGPDGSHQRTVGGPGEQRGQFTAPRSLALDTSRRLYVGAGDDYLIQRFDPAGAYVDAFGNGNLDETLYRVGGLAVADDVLYVAQVTRHMVQAFDVSGNERPRLLWEMGGQPGSDEMAFNGPGGMTVDAGRLYVADTKNNRIVSFQLSRPEKAPAPTP